jgi:hypothetical protein
VLKGGALLDTIDLAALCTHNPAAAAAANSFVTLGRAPGSDVLLDHPSSSRLHAVLQFRGADGAAFLFDPGATHGVFVNKRRAPAREHVRLAVGDQLRFGESSRVHVLGGPAELMPAEGPGREARRQAAALEAMARRREREAAVAAAQMGAAIAGGADGASWGFGEDATGEEGAGDKGQGQGGGGAKGGEGAVDWRAYAATRGLTDRQQKLADRVRKLEARVGNLSREAERIRAKQTRMEELSAGQASTLARNEAEVDRAAAEGEEVEGALADSIRDSLGQRAGGDKKGKKRRARAARDSDDEYAAGSSDDDRFYDRTGGGGARRAKAPRGGGGGGGGPGVKQEVEDAASLYGKLQALQEERAAAEGRLRAEEAAAAAPAAPAAAPPAQEPLQGGRLRILWVWRTRTAFL